MDQQEHDIYIREYIQHFQDVSQDMAEKGDLQFAQAAKNIAHLLRICDEVWAIPTSEASDDTRMDLEDSYVMAAPGEMRVVLLYDLPLEVMVGEAHRMGKHLTIHDYRHVTTR